MLPRWGHKIHRRSRTSADDARELLVAEDQSVALLGEHRYLRSHIRRHKVRKGKPYKDDMLGSVRRSNAAVLRVEN